MRGLFVAALAGTLAFGAAAEEKLPPGFAVDAQAQCPDSLSGLGNKPGVVIGCYCPPGPPPAASVWGSGTYTADSGLCTAAHHAGAVGEGGGAIWAMLRPGQDSYDGTTANGVTTAGYGGYGTSFIVRAAVQSAPACPTTMQGVKEALTCACPGGAVPTDTVWGTDIYTEDSNVCKAALHAGAATKDGGVVRIMPGAGLQSYAGSERNGVKTVDYGPWGASFTFVK